MTAVDLGCGVGGPLIEIARFCGARIVGVSDNALHLERADRRSEAAGLSHLTDWLKCDFMQVDAPDASFDAAYSIEASCCAPDKAGVYGEAFRVLKPGGCFAAYEYCLTDRFDADDPDHQRLKADIEVGGGLPDIARPHEIDDALREVGFELTEARDLAAEAPPGIPWYQPLVGSGLSFASFRSSPAGRRPPADPWIALAARTAEDRAARNDPGFEHLEPCRRRLRGSRSSRHLHADVFLPRPQAGIAGLRSRRARAAGPRPTRALRPCARPAPSNCGKPCARPAPSNCGNRNAGRALQSRHGAEDTVVCRRREESIFSAMEDGCVAWSDPLKVVQIY